MDLFVNDEGELTGEGLLGKPEFFISHWWGYKAVDLLTMVLAHDSERTAAGEPHAAYFLDMFVLNQHQMTKDCTTDEDKRAQLVDSLRFSLRACGTLLLCCTSGPSGDAGWERPAPIERVWCLFEVYVAITEDAKVTVRLAPKDADEFRQALNNGGMERLTRALHALDASNAGASVESDKQMILGDIDSTVGLGEFNQRVRQSMLAQFKQVATEYFAWSAYLGGDLGMEDPHSGPELPCEDEPRSDARYLNDIS